MMTIEGSTDTSDNTEWNTQRLKSQHQSKKAPGFDLITGEILKQLPKKDIVKLTLLYNASFRLKYA